MRLAEAQTNQVFLDPMCGAGTIVAEQIERCRSWRNFHLQLLGGDQEQAAVRAAAGNLRRLGQVGLARWDATRLPLPDQSVDRIVSNPPFGKQLGVPEEIGPLYAAMVREYDRVLRPGGRAVLLVRDVRLLRDAATEAAWKKGRMVRVRILGQMATITAWKKWAAP